SAEASTTGNPRLGRAHRPGGRSRGVYRGRDAAAGYRGRARRGGGRAADPDRRPARRPAVAAPAGMELACHRPARLTCRPGGTATAPGHPAPARQRRAPRLMPRPPMPVGGHGSIAFQTLGRRKVRARCWVRDVDGVRRRVETIGTSRANAREKLLAALQLRPGFRRAGLAGTSTIAEAIDVWLAELDRRAADGEIAISTPTTYRSVVNVHVRPGLGALRLQEVDAPTLDAFLVGMRARHGFAVTKTARSALNGVFGLAIRQHAIRANPMRD